MGLQLTPGDYSNLLRRCAASLLHVKTIHAAVLRRLLYHEPALTSDLISHYSLHGSLPLAHSTFSTSLSPPPHTSVFNALIRAYTDHGPPHEALALYHHMRSSGLNRDPHTYPIVIKACSSLRNLGAGVEVHRDADALGFASRVPVVNALISFYGKCGSLDLARKLFDEMPERTPVSWSAMIAAFAFNGLREEALGMFSRMIAEGVPPNRGTLVSLMGCVVDVDSAEKLWEIVEKNELEGDELVRDAAVKMFVRCGGVANARRLFDGLAERSLSAWNSMISGCAESGSPVEALELFGEMVVREVVPNRGTALAVVRACCELGLEGSACWVHGYVLKNFGREEEGLFLENALIDLYVKCGRLVVARRLFDQMEVKDVGSWNVMIAGYGMHGQGKEALDLFDRMKAHVQPDHGTFSSVLASCSLAGLVEEGRRFFDSMKHSDLVPEAEDYACVVHMLGRADLLDEARDFVKMMPIEPNASVWEALLSACRNHSNVELAESSARSLLELDPNNRRSCVVLSNIYRCSNREEEAEETAALMQRMAMKEIVGFSFVEANHVPYKFLTGDRSNPQSDEIYIELDKLVGRIKEHGYEPENNLILHDIEEETIVKSLHEHSEKLAVVFGLLNSNTGSEILVHKNNSVCADCHTFMKSVSKVADRVIVLRDAHRFHHFIDGACSCKDYWW